MYQYIFTAENERNGELIITREYAYNLAGAVEKFLEFYGLQEREIISIIIEKD